MTRGSASSRRLAALSVAVFVSACAEDLAPARPQALVLIDVDGDVPRLANRLRVRVLDEAGADAVGCEGCAREIAIDQATAWPISFGVVPPSDGGRRFVEATLYNAGRFDGDVVAPETSVRATAWLQFVDAVVPQLVRLSFRCAGIASGPTESCADGAVGPIGPAIPVVRTEPTRRGTFRAGHARPCVGAPSEGEVCVAGGTFWMGDARRQGFGPAFDAVPEHLVTVSPFFLDTTEYTVGRYEDALRDGFVSASRSRPLAVGALDQCTLGAAVDNARDHPLNCVSPALAGELCEFENKRLPTEAEWEWAAGGREEERLLPWGNRRRGCETPGACEPSLGTYPVGTRPWDSSADGILDMASNVSEYVADAFQTYEEPCWAAARLAATPDPRCDPPDGEPNHGRSVRGGHAFPLDVGDYGEMVATRRYAGRRNVSTDIGFRCARSE